VVISKASQKREENASVLRKGGRRGTGRLGVRLEEVQCSGDGGKEEGGGKTCEQ
jgi:hypothetical protein